MGKGEGDLIGCKVFWIDKEVYADLLKYRPVFRVKKLIVVDSCYSLLCPKLFGYGA